MPKKVPGMRDPCARRHPARGIFVPISTRCVCDPCAKGLPRMGHPCAHAAPGVGTHPALLPVLGKLRQGRERLVEGTGLPLHHSHLVP